MCTTISYIQALHNINASDFIPGLLGRSYCVCNVILATEDTALGFHREVTSELLKIDYLT
jgi:hypothetical protein